MVEFANKYGNGKYNWTAASEFRYHRIVSSMQNNSTFGSIQPRYFTAYTEATFPNNFDGRVTENRALPTEDARGFFQDSRMPKGFHRVSKPSSTEDMEFLVNSHPIRPGGNVNGTNSYEANPNEADLSPTVLLIYKNSVNRSVRMMCPNPTEVLKVLNLNMQWFYDSISDRYPNQVFLYGKGDE